MRYLVTGGLGYVGSWVTRHLALAGHAVTALSRGGEKPDLGAPYSLLRADITAPDLAKALVPLLHEGLHGCIHLASYNEGHEPGYGEKALRVNALGTRNLLEALGNGAGDAGAPPPLVLYASTFHVYGRGSGVVTEETPAEPRNEYALTHFMGEEYCRYFQRTAGIPSVILRLSNGYGAPLTHPFGKWYLLLCDLCRAAFVEKKLRLRSAPSTRRDFLWLGDTAACMEALLARPDLAGHTFTVASGFAPSIGEVAALVASVYEKRYGKAISVELPPESGAPANAPLTLATERLRAALGGFTFHDRMAGEINDTFAFLERHGA